MVFDFNQFDRGLPEENAVLMKSSCFKYSRSIVIEMIMTLHSTTRLKVSCQIISMFYRT